MIRNKYTILVGVFAFFMLFQTAQLCADDVVNKAGDTIAQDSAVQTIDIDIAKAVAADYLPKYYKGNWVFFDYFVCFDLDGSPAAYAIIFRKPNAPITTYEELNSTVQEILEKRDQILKRISQTQESTELSEEVKKKELINLKKLLNRQKRALYQANIFATVITGTTEVSPLLIRCYKGLPSFFVKKFDMESKLASQYPDKKLQLGRILYFSPVDIRYEIMKGDKSRVPARINKRVEEKLKQKIPNDSLTMLPSKVGKKLVKISYERQMMKKRLAEKKQTLEKMSDKHRKMLKEGEIKRKQHNISKWTKYKKRHLEELGIIHGRGDKK
jgi:hypothetical protein